MDRREPAATHVNAGIDITALFTGILSAGLKAHVGAWAANYFRRRAI
jgi:hypothetical protein